MANAAAAPAPASTSLRPDGVEAAGARGVGTAAGCTDSPYDSVLRRRRGMDARVGREEDARNSLMFEVKTNAHREIDR
jgi:hypothetical protein